MVHFAIIGDGAIFDICLCICWFSFFLTRRVVTRWIVNNKLVSFSMLFFVSVFFYNKHRPRGKHVFRKTFEVFVGSGYELASASVVNDRTEIPISQHSNTFVMNPNFVTYRCFGLSADLSGAGVSNFRTVALRRFSRRPPFSHIEI